jgi:hypothetical protein
MSRQITPVFELNSATSGEPVENVPGNLSGLTIQVNRYDLYTKLMEKAFGSQDMHMLSDQNAPFTVRELWRYPNNTLEALEYQGCWFNNLGRTIQSTNDRIVNVTASLTYVRRRKLQ